MPEADIISDNCVNHSEITLKLDILILLSWQEQVKYRGLHIRVSHLVLNLPTYRGVPDETESLGLELNHIRVYHFTLNHIKTVHSD